MSFVHPQYLERISENEFEERSSQASVGDLSHQHYYEHSIVTEATCGSSVDERLIPSNSDVTLNISNNDSNNNIENDPLFSDESSNVPNRSYLFGGTPVEDADDGSTSTCGLEDKDDPPLVKSRSVSATNLSQPLGETEASSIKQKRYKVPYPWHGEEVEEQVLSLGKSGKEILYEIAMGKWSCKDLVLNKENEGTNKLGSRSCSNAHCVREAELQKRKKCLFKLSQVSLTSDDTEEESIFEDGHLPSYHSLLFLWKERKAKWTTDVFKNGFPTNEQEFLDAWRACRRNPKAYGIKISAPKALPPKRKKEELIFLPKRLLKPKLSSSSDKQSQPPSLLKLSRRESPFTEGDSYLGYKDHEYELMKHRFEQLKILYPHLQPLTPAELKIKGKLKVRLRQAEDWHRLVTTGKKNKVKGAQARPSTSKRLMEINSNIPNYAHYTRNFYRKLQNKS